MNSDQDQKDQAEQTAPDGTADLVRSIILGVICGTATSVTLLILGYSFWFSLLMHSVVGAATMGMVLTFAAMRDQKHRKRPARSASIQTVRQ